MASFASMNSALSAMRYQQVALDIAGTNVANAATEGYVRRRVVGETVGAGPVPALWSRPSPVAAGVRASGIDRMVDPFLEIRGRAEHGRQSYLDLQASALTRVETGLAEPGGNGVSAALAAFKATLHDLVNAPGSDAARSQVLAAANTVADAIRLQARNLAEETSDQQSRLAVTVNEVNTVARELAATNHSIAASNLTAGDTANLLDERDRLSMRLAELTGGIATIRSDGGMDVELNGVSLVSGDSANELEIVSGGKPTAFAISNGGGSVPGSLGGEVGAIADLLDTKLPDYADGLSAVAKSLADALNAQHALGHDRNGDAGGDLFDYDAANVAGTIAVVVTDPRSLAASSVASPDVLDAGNADLLIDSIGAAGVDDAYQQLVNGFGTVVASTKRLAANQQALTNQVDSAREQLAGVSLDEETVNMLTAQRGYEAAARVMTTVDSLLDTLINRTGLVR